MTSFIQRHHRDTHYNYNKRETIHHLASFALIYNSEHGELPWFAKSVYMFLLDVVILGWIQRVKLNSATRKVKYQLNKYIII
jgi:hypothetical protein